MFVLHLLISMLTSSDPVVGEVGSENFNVYKMKTRGLRRKRVLDFFRFNSRHNLLRSLPPQIVQSSLPPPLFFSPLRPRSRSLACTCEAGCVLYEPERREVSIKNCQWRLHTHTRQRPQHFRNIIPLIHPSYAKAQAHPPSPPPQTFTAHLQF